MAETSAVADFAPPDVGANATSNPQVPETGTVLGLGKQVSFRITNSVELTPERLMSVMLRAAVPVFVSVIVCRVDRLPSVVVR